ncbi:MAG: hypothetical protein E7374_00890 [Clostridiales bacterium]|nr:hypothetical protein [Clostridiales bacterium]
MSSKKKLIVSVCSMALVVVAAIVAVVAVWASNRQTVNTNFKVTYKAQDVAVKVSGNYMEKGATALTQMQTAGGVKVHDITPTTESVDAFVIDDIALSDKASYVVFEYIFVNQSDDIKITATLTSDDSKNDNVTVTYLSSATQLKLVADSQAADQDAEAQAVADAVASISGTTASTEIAAGTNTTVYFYVKVAVANAANDMAYEGGHSWDLQATNVNP